LNVKKESRISLPYHSDELEFNLPANRKFLVAGNDFPDTLPDLRFELERSFGEPAGGPGLDSILPASGRVAVLVSDVTRGGRSTGALNILLDYIEKRGMGPERVDIFVATGMHAGRAVEEIKEFFGPDIVSRYRIAEHDAARDSELLYAGTTTAGTRCLFNREVAGSSLVIGIGTVKFHYFAGFGGSRKLILPGVAGEETIVANHRLSLRKDAGEGLEEGCEPGRLKGNPVHEDMMEGASLLPVPVFMINRVSGPAGDPVFINAGEMRESHRRASEFVLDHFTIRLKRRYRAVIGSAGGWPNDINLLQSHKAIRHASMAVEDGGILLFAAGCREGIGSDSYLSAFRDGREGVPAVVSRNYTLNSQAAMSTYDMTGRISIYLKSSLPDSRVLDFGFNPWKIEETHRLLEGIPDKEILVLPHSSCFLPLRRES
jgi:nickel-dependent lactate racemase